jgi:large subunit ribosomal protein L35
MPKLKTSKSAAKRFRVTKRGKVVYSKAFKSHLLAKKKRSRKMSLKKAGTIASRKGKATVKKLLPYG